MNEEFCPQSLERKKELMQATPLSKRNSKLAMARRTSQRQHQQKKRSRNVKSRVRRLRVEMKEISEEQGKIREGQRQVREKCESVELECEQLRKETLLITQQSATTRIRLTLMFQILKARENQELDKAALFTHALRELMERENQQRKL